jgi:glycerol kinase
MRNSYILTFDLGTSSIRVLLFDRDFRIAGMEQENFKQFYPAPDRVEQDPVEIWETQLRITRRLLKKQGIDISHIAGIGITNQRETVVVWDRRSGEPLCPAIVWQDKRTAPRCEEMKKADLSETIRKKTGLVIDAYFSATKLQWILEKMPGAKARAEKGELLFGTVDSWVVWKLSGGKLHITDVSNASRTMLYNIHEKRWDPELLELFGVPEQMLPEVRSSSEHYGNSEPEFLGDALPLCGIAGDQQAALFGQLCHEKGTAKNTYGTGCFMLMNTGAEAVHSKNGLLTTIAWQIGDRLSYALEGSVFIAGAAIRWLRDDLHMITNAADSGRAAMKVRDNGGVYFVPAFSGLGAPHWDMHARGMISGLTQGSTADHIVRAALESIAYQSKDVLDAMERDSGVKLCALNVDGGATVNDFLMQFQADILNCPVNRAVMQESTALGAAMLAGLACGFWSDEDLNKSKKNSRIFEPQMQTAERERLYEGWLKAVSRARL